MAQRKRVRLPDFRQVRNRRHPWRFTVDRGIGT
jgi:hypothetical protein